MKCWRWLLVAPVASSIGFLVPGTSSAVGSAQASWTQSHSPTGDSDLIWRDPMRDHDVDDGGYSVDGQHYTFQPRRAAIIAGKSANPGGKGKIAFAGQTVPGGTFDIFTMNPGGLDLTNITQNPANDLDPFWSADGSRIAFRSNRDGNAEIYLMDANGANPLRLTNNPAPDFQPSLSPDGKSVLFQSFRTGNSQIFIMPVGGKDPEDVRQLSNFTGLGAGEPEVSPDGSMIVFTGVPSPPPAARGAIYTMRADGTHVRQLTPFSMNAANPAWAPDGAQIAFANNAFFTTLASDIFVIRFNGAQVEQLTADFGNNLDPAWSPEGERILFSHAPEAVLPLPPQDLFEIETDDSTMRRLTTTQDLGEIGPVWRPHPRGD